MSDREEPGLAGAPRGGGALSTSPAAKRLGGLRCSVWPLPMALRARLLLLLCSLGCIKMALMVQMRSHLVETHWYLEGRSETWVGLAAFCLFVALGVWSLVGLG